MPNISAPKKNRNSKTKKNPLINKHPAFVTLGGRGLKPVSPLRLNVVCAMLIVNREIYHRSIAIDR
jgi:hypothetical protein